MTQIEEKFACKRCSSCCKYFCITTDPPVDDEDYDDLAWMLIHKDVTIHVCEEVWDIVVKNHCKHLDEAKGCQIYDQRPQICRDHIPGECDANIKTEADYDGVLAVITNLQELYDYRKKEEKKTA